MKRIFKVYRMTRTILYLGNVEIDLDDSCIPPKISSASILTYNVPFSLDELNYGCIFVEMEKPL